MSLFLSRWRDQSPGRTKLGDRRRAGRNRRALSLETMESRTLMTGTITPLVNPVPDGSGTMTLETNGDILMIAGGDSASKHWYQLAPDAKGNYSDGTWTQVASSGLERLFFGSTVLPSGQIMVQGGEYSGPNTDSNYTNTGEIYTPSTNSWAPIAPFPQKQFGDDTLVSLGNGTVLATYLGGPQTYLYTPSSNTWTETGDKLKNDQSDEETFIKLPDGSILAYSIFSSIADGKGEAQRYIPSTGKWVSTGAVPVALSDTTSGYEIGAGLLLPDGRVFQIGATGHTAYYTPSTDSWAAGPDIPASLVQDDAAAALLPNGKVILNADTVGYNGPTHFYEFDPTPGVANPYTDISASFPSGFNDGPAFLDRMLVLPTGQVLINNSDNKLVLYTPDSGSLAVNVPTIKSIAENANGSFSLTGTKLNGNSEGASFGDDAEMSTDYPIVSFTDGAGNVSYGTTYGWTGAVATGTTPVTTNFTLPVGLAKGTYQVKVIANGASSASFNLTLPTKSGDPAPTFATAATATPNPVLTSSTQLSALGADTAGESTLTYTWATTSAPAGAASPTFAINGTNAAKNDTATFHSVGAYTFQVTATNLAGLSTSSIVSVKVNAALTSLALSPTQLQLSPNQTQQFSVASGLDQFGNQITASSLSWAVTSGNGTVTQSGLYTAPAVGTIATVTVSSGKISESAKVYVLSTPWTQADVGSPVTTGASADNGTGTYTVLGSGTGISGASDQFQYAYVTLSGDSTIVAQVNSEQNTSSTAQAGVMFRADTSAGSIYAMVGVSPANGVTFQYRNSAGGATVTLTTPGPKAPEYVKLVRTGNVFSGYYSQNGTTWTLASAPVTIGMGSMFDGGMAVTSGNASTINTATFSGVLADSNPTVVSGATATPSPVKTTTTTLAVLGGDAAGESALTYTWATTGLPGGAISPTFATNGTNASKSDVVTFFKSGTYTFKVTLANALGYSTTSSVTVTVIPTQSSVKLSPTSVIVSEGATQLFVTTAYDQFGLKLAQQPQFTYSMIAGGAGGKVSSTGLYTAPNRTGYDYLNVTGAGTAAVAKIQVIGSPPPPSNAKSISGTQATVGPVSVGWGSAGAASLVTSPDGLRLLPAGRGTDLPWANIRTLTVALSQAEPLSASDVKVTGLAVANYGPVTVSQVTSSTYLITLAQPIAAADRVTVTIANSGIATYTRRLDVLPGDVNDDGIVGSTDSTLATGYLATTFVAADIFGDGVVSSKGVKAIQLLNGTKLPMPT